MSKKKSTKMRSSDKKINQFEVRINRKKHEVLGQRRDRYREVSEQTTVLRDCPLEKQIKAKAEQQLTEYTTRYGSIMQVSISVYCSTCNCTLVYTVSVQYCNKYK